MTINDAGRIRVSAGAAPCVGSYQVADGALTFTYDAGQSNCMNMAGSGRLSADGQTLQFGILASYQRIDATNEPF